MNITIKENLCKKKEMEQKLRKLKHILILESIKNMNYSINDKQKILNSIINITKNNI